MQISRTLAVAASAALMSLTVSPVADAAAGSKPATEPCAHQAQQVEKAEHALAHVISVFDHQKTRIEKVQEALAAATTPEEQARLQAKLDKALAKKQHAQKEKKAQQQRLAKAQARLADCQSGNPV